MAAKKKSGKVKNNVIWLSDEEVYREVLDDSKPDLELGEICHSVITNAKTGEGHFEYGPGKDS
jgi:hypothetical protein